MWKPSLFPFRTIYDRHSWWVTTATRWDRWDAAHQRFPIFPGDGQEDECAKGNGVLQHQQGRNKLHLGKFCDFCWQFLTLKKKKKTSIDVVQTTWEIVVEKTDVVYVITS